MNYYLLLTALLVWLIGGFLYSKVDNRALGDSNYPYPRISDWILALALIGLMLGVR